MYSNTEFIDTNESILILPLFISEETDSCSNEVFSWFWGDL